MQNEVTEEIANEVIQRIANRSDSIAALADALSKAQGAMEGALKDSSNPFFKSKYADLASVWSACREALSINGLAVVQMPSSYEGLVQVETVLMHSSGEWISSVLTLRPTKDDPQGMGSTISYARRYALASMVGVYQEDDDGNKGSGKRNVEEPPEERTKDAQIAKDHNVTAPVGTKEAAQQVAQAKLAKAKQPDLVAPLEESLQLEHEKKRLSMELAQAPEHSDRWVSAVDEYIRITKTPVSKIDEVIATATERGQKELQARKNGVFTPAQVKQLWTVIRKQKWSDDLVHAAIKKLYGVESTKEIPAVKFEECVIYFDREAPERV